MENQFLVGYITKYKYVIQGNTEETNLRLSGVDLRRDNPEERIQFEKALLSACESLKKPIPELSNKPDKLDASIKGIVT